MSKFYVDATVPLNWGPQPAVGIPRVEFAIVRQALRQEGNKVAFFCVGRSGVGRLLDARETRHLADLVEGRLRSIEDGEGERFAARLGTVVRSI
ncbi:MAG: hypothetical protein J0H54_09300, partial [Rhizobiales bacterium]|nr:hypothetical protein [Hyphomicrobiales bacterium]